MFASTAPGAVRAIGRTSRLSKNRLTGFSSHWKASDGYSNARGSGYTIAGRGRDITTRGFRTQGSRETRTRLSPEEMSRVAAPAGLSATVGISLMIAAGLFLYPEADRIQPSNTAVMEGVFNDPPVSSIGAVPSTQAPPKSRYSYVIIGAGTTANAAVEAILHLQPDADILLLSDEAPSCQGDNGGNGHDSDFHLLSDDLLESYNQWRRHINARLDGYVSTQVTEQGESGMSYSSRGGDGIRYYKYETGGLRIDPERRCISLDDGVEVFYNKCLIATSGKPRKFYAALDSERSHSSQHLKEAINTLVSVNDFGAVERLFENGSPQHITVIGGGFLGSEVALALANRGRDKGVSVAQWQTVKLSTRPRSYMDIQPVQVYAEKGPMQRLLPPYLVGFMKQRLQEAGVTPVGERLVTDFRINSDTKRVELVLQGWAKQTLETDYIVLASTHIEPKVDVARESGLEIDQNNGGIVVNGLFEAINGIYAAGNLASYFDPALGRRRIDRYDHSVNSGLCAGYNMAATLKATMNDKDLHHGWRQSAELASEENGTATPPKSRPPPGPHPRAYTHQPIWRSHLVDCDIVMEGVGEIDARLRTVGMWVDRADDSDIDDEQGVAFPAKDPTYQRGIIYYLRGDKVVGILLYNTPDLLERAREVLRLQPKITSMKQLKRQIPLAPDDWLRLEETSGSIQFGNEILTPPF
ncbi:unnamed protein product [Discosporangium mesarthrocarpum]